MQTFSKQREVKFQEVPFFVEAKRPEDVELLKAVAATLSEKVYEASSEQRKSLHLAAVFIYQRKHDIERQVVFFKQISC